MSKLSDSRKLLSSSWGMTQQVWDEARSHWHDPVGDKFEYDYWTKYRETVPKALNAMAQLEEALEAAKSKTR